MISYIKTELMKEKRLANLKLGIIVPIIFVLFNIAMISLMGKAQKEKSYILATSFNWYPLLILPIVLSLLVVNINVKEKSEHIVLQKAKI